jgi:hypothetical protein
MSAAPILARTLKYQVRISKGDGAGTLFHFDQGVVTVGRGAENDIVLANDPKVSRQHFEFRIQSGSLLVKNISKKNFVLINGETVEEKLCEQNFRLQVGSTELEIQLDLPVPAPAPAGQNHLSLLQDVVEPGPVNAVPSPLQKTKDMPVKASSPVRNSSMSMGAPRPTSQPRRNAAPRGGGGSKLSFYLIVIVVIGGFFWLLSGPSAPTAKDANLRTEADVLRSIEESANAVKELKQQRQAMGQDSLQYQLAEQNYVKGFRDYLQGQYARALVSFQAALSFYPQHEMARKYLVLSQRKFDESVDQNMSLGRSYYKRQNWRLCQSSFANVMIMLKDPSKAKYKEAKQIYDECSIRLRGGY